MNTKMAKIDDAISDIRMEADRVMHLIENAKQQFTVEKEKCTSIEERKELFNKLFSFKYEDISRSI
ncbi:MAG: hypothetical protein P4L61_01870 [Candidatus Pacebacteria bacterium]|nr:hypothetical protein [Candidatus Paceibacterota bacterium]